jgi:hypothetical protein
MDLCPPVLRDDIIYLGYLSLAHKRNSVIHSYEPVVTRRWRVIDWEEESLFLPSVGGMVCR